MERECFEEVLTSWDFFEFLFLYINMNELIECDTMTSFEKEKNYENFSRSFGLK